MSMQSPLTDEYQLNFLSDVDRWRVMYQNRATKNIDDYEALKQLLTDFARFAGDYFGYFEERIVGGMIKSLTSNRLRDRALGIILDEWNHISRAVEQRQLDRYQKWFWDVERDTRRYLPLGMPNIVICLGEANAIRNNLYSQVALVTIRREQFGLDDYMAVPHEIGHQVYANLSPLSTLNEMHQDLCLAAVEIAKEIADKYSLLPDPRNYLCDFMSNSVEETFADVYGTVVAGLPFARSIGRILRRKVGSRDDLFIDDNEHVIPYLRPLLRLFVLEQMEPNEELTADIESEKYQWAQFIENELGGGVRADEQVPFVVYLGPPSPKGEQEEKTVMVPLSALSEATETFVAQHLLPLVNSIWEKGMTQSQTATFQQLLIDHQHKEHDLDNLLLHPLSQLSGETNTNHPLGGYHKSSDEGETKVWWVNHGWITHPH